MRAVELFAGAGGAALGLHAAGVEHLRCVEWDESAAATLAAAGFPAIRGDVRNLGHYDLLSPDLVWSSFPCQCWSSAGKRLGPEDERNGWPWTVDAIDAMRPRWFVAENVTGLTQHRGECAGGCVGPGLCPRAYLDRVILEQLRERFPWVACRVLNASSYGVPQHRRRLIIVAGPRPIDWPQPTHGKPTGQGDLFGKRLLPWRTAREALGLSLTTTKGHGLGKTPAPVPAGPSPTITTHAGKTTPWQSAGTPYVAGGNSKLSQGARRGLERMNRPAPTVCAYPNGKGSGQWSAGAATRQEMAEATGRRRLTVQECAALQDFPPDHPWQGTKTSQYTQVGNAVPPTLARVVAEAVLEADAT